MALFRLTDIKAQVQHLKKEKKMLLFILVFDQDNKICIDI